MNRNQQILSKLLVVILLATGTLNAQKNTKTYKETFNVGDDAVLELNTTHTDIEFETWDKNQVEIVATVELEDASEEEINDYFKEDPVRIVGNSKSISVSTARTSLWSSNFDYHVVGDVISDIEPLFLDIEIPELEELAEIPELFTSPPLPPIHFSEFDHEAYKKDGEKYLKKWTKQFRKDFDGEYREKLEAWGKQYEDLAKEREDRIAKRAKAWEKRAEERTEQAKKRAEKLEKRYKVYSGNSFFSRDGDDESNVFYLFSDGKSKKQKVKKTIKIKMPKSTRLKMNVKHGEVKLAATTKNLNASLRYVSLLASTIEGDLTTIEAAYSPVVVQRWNYGQLKADYADHINLKEVDELRLDATSSNISIDRLNNRAIVRNNLGELVIHQVSNSFSDLDVEVQNGEFRCTLPKTATSFYLNGTKSSFSYPSKLQMEKTTHFNKEICKGYLTNANSGKRITVNSKYSTVVLTE